MNKHSFNVTYVFALALLFSSQLVAASQPSKYCGFLDSATIEQVRDPIRSDWVLALKGEAKLSRVASFNANDKLPTSNASSDWTVKVQDIRAVQSAVKLLLDDQGLTKSDFGAQPFMVTSQANQGIELCVEAADKVADVKTTIAHKIYRLWGYQAGQLVLSQDFRD